MATQKIISANNQKNNGATVLNGGTADGENVTNVVTIATVTYNSSQGPVIAVSPSASGNVGGKKILSGGTYKKAQPMVDGVYIGRTYNNVQIAGTASNLLKGGSDVTRRPYHVAPKQEALGVSSINAFTGAVTYDTSKQGSGVPYLDPATGNYINNEAFPTDAIPGELVYMVKGTDATQADYEKRTH